MDDFFAAQLIDHLQTGIVLLDSQGRVTAWNAWMTRYSALGLSEVANKRLDEVFPEIAQTRLQGCIEQALRFNLSSMLAPGLNAAVLPLYQKQSDRQPDRRMQQLVYVTPLRNSPCACMIQIQDMTATVRRERRLRAQSSQLIETTFRDPLTGVGNRRRFDQDLVEQFKDAQDKQQPLALLLIDVDDFKAYNDTLGHPKGDECLVLVATTMQEALRQRGDSISRYGGEEFTLLLPGADRGTACAIAERLRRRIEQLALPHPTSRSGDCVTVSIGVTTIVPTHEQIAYILIGQADLALYMAKDAGRNRCMCYDASSSDAHACN